MPQFKVAKAKKSDTITNNPKVEDKLYIYKETNKLGRLYFDFDDNTRIEIGSTDNIYFTDSILTKDVENISIGYIKKFNSDETETEVVSDEIKINSFVVSNKSIYNIRNIDRTNTDNTTLTLRKIYTQQDLMWNDYYTE